MNIVLSYLDIVYLYRWKKECFDMGFDICNCMFLIFNLNFVFNK